MSESFNLLCCELVTKPFNFQDMGPAVWKPISANPGLNLNPGFFTPLFKSLLLDSFLYYSWSTQLSNCIQKEFYWIFFLSFQIWNQIPHQPWVILTHLWTTWHYLWILPSSFYKFLCKVVIRIWCSIKTTVSTWSVGDSLLPLCWIVYWCCEEG